MDSADVAAQQARLAEHRRIQEHTKQPDRPISLAKLSDPDGHPLKHVPPLKPEFHKAHDDAANRERSREATQPREQSTGLDSEMIAKKARTPGLHPKGPLRDAGAAQSHKEGMAKDSAAAAAENARLKQIAAEARRAQDEQKARQSQQNMKNSKDGRGKE